MSATEIKNKSTQIEKEIINYKINKSHSSYQTTTEDYTIPNK